jgi:hypothetical protein
MHIISDKSLKRPGYTYQRTPGGAFVGYPTDFRPATVNWKNVDGPLLYLKAIRDELSRQRCIAS